MHMIGAEVGSHSNWHRIRGRRRIGRGEIVIILILTTGIGISNEKLHVKWKILEYIQIQLHMVIKMPSKVADLFGKHADLMEGSSAFLERCENIGRYRKHQGLAAAILKLWEKCEIAKIVVKKGVQNTNTELMAKELQWLTGGTLITRDKEYIVLYRGKDFLPSSVSSAIEQRRKHGYPISSKDRLLQRLKSDVSPRASCSSTHTNLSVKFQSHCSRDYRNPMLLVASSAIDATGIFSFGHVLKIAMFDKNGGVQALIQYSDSYCSQGSIGRTLYI
ncbi:unnamed protein product [Lactuca saligna]|uniref:CRM domain-containing protein n=1 Tax=Lactuca saligna TaxID=75948 RepID=A0AA35VND8_LACSI|nr:unnamed protein product [Lactuca saligna]